MSTVDIVALPDLHIQFLKIYLDLFWFDSSCFYLFSVTINLFLMKKLDMTFTSLIDYITKHSFQINNNQTQNSLKQFQVQIKQLL